MNKPPEKIYLQWEHYDEGATIYLNDVTWCVDKINEDDIEYVRADLYECAKTRLREEVLIDVLNERDRQDEIWGEQNHDPMTWMAILGEEVGEANREALNMKFPKDSRYGESDGFGFRYELIQVAAVALAIVECLDRGKWENKDE